MGRLFRKITAEKGARSARKPRSLCAFHAYARSRREFERAMMAKRVRAGLARVRGEGKRLGRPWAARCARHCQIVRSRSRDRAADQPPFRHHSFRQSVFPGCLAHAQRIQDRGSASTTAGLASNSPPACGPAGYLNGMRPGSELGWQVAVDFESDTDFLECGSCPIHSCLPAFHNDQQPKLDDV